VRGMDRMAGLLRPSLGPLPRTVAVAPIVGSGPPEILDSAATIARRTLQLADPFENMGAMLVRHAAWRVFERAGDGAATTAVLAQAMARAGARYVAAGGNPVALRRGLELGLATAAAELRRQARPVDLPSDLARLVGGTLREHHLAELIGEVLDTVGPDGAVLVEDGETTETVREYLDGVRWNEGYVSPFLLGRGEGATARLLNPRLLVTDHPLERREQLVPALEACVGAGDRSFLVVAPHVSDPVVGLLAINRERGVLDAALAVKAPSFGEQRTRILEDLAVATGGRCVRAEAGERLEDVTAADLGRARQAWATRSAFAVIGGAGSRAAIRQRVAEAKAELRAVEAATDADPYVRDKIAERIGKLAGSAAVVKVGAASQAARAELKLRVEAAVRAARAAQRSGVVPGGGAALLACVPAVSAMPLGGDEAVGAAVLARALCEPMRAILENAGLAPGPIVAAPRPGCAFDVLRRAWVDPWADGILDPLAVVEAALETSVSTAATSLTAEVLIRHKRAPVAVEP
jgi:chaperonin GroEL